MVYQTLDRQCADAEQGPLWEDTLFVLVLGVYRSRYLPPGGGARWRPDPLTIGAVEELILSFLLPHYDLTPQSLLLGCESGSEPWVPGDWWEQWVRHLRDGWYHPDSRDLFASAGGPHSSVPLLSVPDRVNALSRLGIDLKADQWTSEATQKLRHYQRTVGVPPTGVWCAQTEKAVRYGLSNLLS